MCDSSPKPKTELTAKICATGRSRKPKNLDIRVTKKVTCRTAGKRKSTSPQDQNKKKARTLAEARQECIPTSSFSTNNNLVVRGKCSFCFTCSSTSEKHFSVEKNSIRNCNFKRRTNKCLI